MATIKSFSDLQQSKKLAEILPLESADMHFVNNKHAGCVPYLEIINGSNPWLKGTDISPCWSLAALLNLLPNEISTGERYCDKYQIDIRKYDGGDNTTLYQIAYGNNRGLSGSWHDMINTSEKESAIDACYEMIILLNELKML